MDLAHANSLVDQCLADARQPEYPRLVDMAEVYAHPTGLRAVDAVVEAYPELTTLEAIDLLEGIDFAALRREVAK